MSIEYYAFALFIAGLVCLVAILCKVLFTDLKRQKKLLDEKETHVLQLYRTVESIMEEFTDQVKATIEEIKECENRAALRSASLATPIEPAIKEPLPEKQQPRGDLFDPVRLRAASEAFDPNRIRAAGEIFDRAERIVKSETVPSVATPTPASVLKEENGAVFQRFFDEPTAAPAPMAVMEAAPPTAQTRNEAILALSAEGKTEAEIASSLGITRNEVRLVIDLNGK